ncbi:MAG: hypothetical protein ABI831_20880 [Betaproteobacteria bacterium]
MILQVSPESSALVHGAAATILYLHIGGGVIGIVSGAAALAFRKGSRPHRIAGNVFFVSMLIMSAIGAAVSPFLHKPFDSIMGVFTFYLVVTAWVTVRRKAGSVGRVETVAFLVALSAAAATLAFGVQAANSPKGLLGGYPATAYYVLAAIVALAAASDLRMMLRCGVSGARRIARHLGRMCVALFVAAGSLFLGQPQVFPLALRESNVLFVPVLLVIILTIFWMCRVRLSSAYRSGSNDRQGLNRSLASP